jgi:class 3 adenylate cyclase
MAIRDEVRDDINKALTQKVDVRDGTVVPEVEDVMLNQGVNLNVTMLYADLADSTGIATYDRQMAARLIKAFLSCSARLIRHNGGYVRSFDGDRVMGVFIDQGNSGKNTSAVRCGMNIDWAVYTVIRPAFENAYAVFKNGWFPLYQCVGVDTGEHLVVRAGIRNNNDLTWIGRAANIAAKLSTVRTFPYTVQITQRVYDNMNDSVKFTEGKNMWSYNRGDNVADPNTITYTSWCLAPS